MYVVNKIHVKEEGFLLWKKKRKEEDCILHQVNQRIGPEIQVGGYESSWSCVDLIQQHRLSVDLAIQPSI